MSNEYFKFIIQLEVMIFVTHLIAKVFVDETFVRNWNLDFSLFGYIAF